MTTETDKQFVERINEQLREHAWNVMLDVEYDRFAALALRGAETQWRPIEEALRVSRNVMLMWDGERCFVGWWKSGTFWRERDEPFDATHFIPLTALGEPTPQPMEKVKG